MEYLFGVCNSTNKSSINCWNCTTGNKEHVYFGKHKPLRNSLCILQNEYVLIAEEDKPLLHLWPINSQESKLKLILPGKPQAVCIDNTNTYLLVGIGMNVYIWMINSGELLNVIEKNYQPVSCLKVSNTTEHIVIGGKDGFITTYNFNTAVSKKLIKNFEQLYVKGDHTEEITGLDIGTFRSKSRIVSISLDKSCRVYDLNSGELLKVYILNTPLTSLSLDAMSWNIYLGDTQGDINVIEIQGGVLTEHIENNENFFKGHSKKIISIATNKSHSLLATASEDCSIIIWDLKSKKQIRVFKQELPPCGLLFFPAHSNIRSKTFKPQLEIKPLKKSALVDVDGFEITVVQNVDIEFEDDLKNEGTDGVRSSKSGEEDRLRIVNKQLYDVINGLIKKSYGD